MHYPGLTTLTSCGGCAAKRGADLLTEAIAELALVSAPPELLVGLQEADDSAVYHVAPDVAVMATVDFFPPIVDDPTTFGEIAAANAVSDIFAMGGRVLFALSVAAFPEDMPKATIQAIFSGASKVVQRAGGIVAGGHTINDAEPKYGLAVIGSAHPGRLLRKSGAAPGDRLMLTKPLGTGLILSAARQEVARSHDVNAAIDSMRSLNMAAAEVFVQFGLRSVTDVTGFGLLGHAGEMAAASGAALVIDSSELPVLSGALEAAELGIETGGAKHNRRYHAEDLRVEPGVDSRILAVAHDPQTSGGLLAAVPSEKMTSVGAALQAAGAEYWLVGHVEDGVGVVLRTTGS